MISTVNYNDLLHMSDEDKNTFVAQLGLPQSELPVFMKDIKTHYSDKPYCVVSDWRWLEQDIPLFNDKPLRVYYIFAEHVIDDEQKRYLPGHWARSSPMEALHDNCVFETSNTFYVLVNRDLDEKNTGTS